MDMQYLILSTIPISSSSNKSLPKVLARKMNIRRLHAHVVKANIHDPMFNYETCLWLCIYPGLLISNENTNYR